MSEHAHDRAAALLRTNLLHVFGERDEARRTATAAQVYVEEPTFTDHDGTVTGRDAIVRQAGEILARVPDDFAFAEDGPAYGDGARIALPWRFGPPDGPAAVRGLDLATVVDGRIATLEVLIAH